MDKKTNFSGWNKGFEYLWIDSIEIIITIVLEIIKGISKRP